MCLQDSPASGFIQGLASEDREEPRGAHATYVMVMPSGKWGLGPREPEPLKSASIQGLIDVASWCEKAGEQTSKCPRKQVLTHGLSGPVASGYISCCPASGDAPSIWQPPFLCRKLSLSLGSFSMSVLGLIPFQQTLTQAHSKGQAL